MEINRRNLLCIIVPIVVLTSAILLGESFDTCEPDVYCIRFNRNTQHIDDDKVYGHGRYFVGVGQEFLSFPRTILSISFTHAGTNWLVARSRDGMQLSLDASMQYRLSHRGKDLIRLYSNFGRDYRPFYYDVARSTIRDVAARFTSFEFFTKRVEIADAMQEEIDDRFEGMFGDLVAFQLLNLDFHQQLQDSIEETEVAFQDIEQAQFEQQVRQVKADQVVETAQLTAVTKILAAKARAAELLEEANAEAAALEPRIEAQVAGFLNLQDKFNFTSPSETLSYLWMIAVKESQSGSISMSLDPLSYLSDL